MQEDLIYEILSVVEEIPEGCVATYGQIEALYVVRIGHPSFLGNGFVNALLQFFRCTPRLKGDVLAKGTALEFDENAVIQMLGIIHIPLGKFRVTTGISVIR